MPHGTKEVKKNTLPFLNSLPISPFKFWLIKLLFSVLFAGALYAIYIVLSLVCGATHEDLYQLLIKYPAIGLGIPALALCFGFYNTMLPSEYVALSFLILIHPGTWLASNLTTLFSINYNIFNLLLCLMFISVSAAAFINDHNQNHSCRGVKAISMLLIGLIAFLLVWTALDKSVDTFKPSREPVEFYFRPANNGKNVMVTTVSPRSTIDVISPRHSYYTLKRGLPSVTSIDNLFRSNGEGTSLVLMINVQDGSFKQIGQRGSYFVRNETSASSYSVNGFSRVLLSQSTLGFFRGYKSAIVDSEGNIAALLPGDGPDYDYSDDYFFIDEKRFIYRETIKNGQNEVTDYVLYEKDKGLKTFLTTQSDFGFHQFISAPAGESGKPEKFYIVGSSDKYPGNLVLISVPDGKLQTFPVNPAGEILLSSSELIVYKTLRQRAVHQPRQYDLYLVCFDGSVKPLIDFPEKAEIIAVSPEEKLLTLIPDPTDEQANFYWQALVEINHENSTSRELLRPEEPFWASHFLSSDGKKILFQTSNKNENNESDASRTYSIDISSGNVSKFQNLEDKDFYLPEQVFAVNENKLILLSYNSWHSRLLLNPKCCFSTNRSAASTWLPEKKFLPALLLKTAMPDKR